MISGDYQQTAWPLISLFLTSLPWLVLVLFISHCCQSALSFFLSLLRCPRNCYCHTFCFLTFLSLWLEFLSPSFWFDFFKKLFRTWLRCLLWFLWTLLCPLFVFPSEHLSCRRLYNWVHVCPFLWTACIVSSMKGVTWVFYLSVSRCLAHGRQTVNMERKIKQRV